MTTRAGYQHSLPFWRLVHCAATAFSMAACASPPGVVKPPGPELSKPVIIQQDVPAESPAPAGACAPAHGLTELALPSLEYNTDLLSVRNLRLWVGLLADPSLHGRAGGSEDTKRVAGLLARAFASFKLSAPYLPAGDHCQPFDRKGVADQNVIAHLRRSPDPNAPVVVLGAHYDAQGMDETGAVHPGADDNASGVAVLMELSRLIGRRQRTGAYDIVIIALGAEERGILGAHAWVENPTVPLSRVMLMINLDMVGRKLLDDHPVRKLLDDPDRTIGYIPGSKVPGEITDAFQDASRRSGTNVVGIPEALLLAMGFSSDSVVFGEHVPALFLSTSIHPDYHSPTDTSDKIVPDQMLRAAALVLATLDELERVQPKP